MADRQTTNSLFVSTLNCEGINIFNDSQCDILCLQETWLLDQTLDCVVNVHPDYLHASKSGVDSTANILPGCPSGGVSMLYKKSLGRYVKNIHVSSSRICGVTIQTSVNHKILVLCVYLCKAGCQTCPHLSYAKVWSCWTVSTWWPSHPIQDVVWLVVLVYKGNCNALFFGFLISLRPSPQFFLVLAYSLLTLAFSLIYNDHGRVGKI